MWSHIIVGVVCLLIGWNVPAPQAALEFWAWAKRKIEERGQ